jgi:hypothetical protein
MLLWTGHVGFPHNHVVRETGYRDGTARETLEPKQEVDEEVKPKTC